MEDCGITAVLFFMRQRAFRRITGPELQFERAAGYHSVYHFEMIIAIIVTVQRHHTAETDRPAFTEYPQKLTD